jgi:secretion/DNA translocation related TadE-like protein
MFATHRRAETGSATMWVASMTVVLGAVTLVLAHIGGVLAERRQAESAADLAALAGAAAVQHGRDGCARAGVIAGRNGADLTACSVSGRRVTVRVRREVELPVLGEVPVTARARAGPARIPAAEGSALGR